MTDTSPSELARIHRTAEDELETRRELLTGMAILMDRSKQSMNWQDGSDEWRANHDRNDAASFAELRSDVASLRRTLGAVNSSVSNEQLNSRYTLKEMVIGFLVLCGALGGLIGFIVWAIGNAGAKP